MDIITHGVSGALLARAAFDGPTREAATVALTAGALVPDLDFLLLLRSRYAYLTGHRGITHSVFGIPLIAPLLAALLHGIGPPASYLFYLGLVALGMGLHVVFDLITSWGTMLLAPVSRRTFYGSWISFRNRPFVFSLWGALLVSFFLDPRWSSALCAAALCVAFGMMAVAGAAQAVARRRFREALEAAGIKPVKVEGFPRGDRLLTWSIFAESRQGFHHGRVRVLSRDPIEIREVAKAPGNGCPPRADLLLLRRHELRAEPLPARGGPARRDLLERALRLRPVHGARPRAPRGRPGRLRRNHARPGSRDLRDPRSPPEVPG
jgi:inner membrane protein